MHYPNGWDVSWNTILADDFLYTETGDITDFHFWYSWRGDLVGDITNVIVNIWSDNPSGPSGYSEPDEFLWSGNFADAFGKFNTRFVETGDQGWYDPAEPVVIPWDHSNTYQLNIVDIPEPFKQTEGTIYWVMVGVEWEVAVAELGWKTSQDHWNDDAVWWDGAGWQELRDPDSSSPDYGKSLDLAFVITPEPATIVLLGFGSLALLRKKRRARA